MDSFAANGTAMMGQRATVRRAREEQGMGLERKQKQVLK